MSKDNKITLYGFNNLTKSLSFSLYKVHYLQDSNQLSHYKTYINEHYHSEKLSQLLTKVCHAIGGNVLNIAKQDYQPQGASATLMISEEAKPESLVAHLDKSHLCIHTYPEEQLHQNIVIFRADIELSTCGVISPLKVLDYVIESFDADVVDIDYRVRGMTRNANGKKLFSDHIINNISENLSAETLSEYQTQDSNLANKGLFHCRLKRAKLNLTNHLFAATIADFSTPAQQAVSQQLELELSQLFLA